MKIKKRLIYFLISFFITFSFLLVITASAINNFKKKKSFQNNIAIEEKNINFFKGSTLRLKKVSTNEIVAMDINEYLSGVLPSEMPPYYEMEALKAQAIIARTYTYKRIQESMNTRDYDITDTHTIDQAYITKEKLFQVWEQRGYDENTRMEYWNKVISAIKDTEDVVAIYDGNYINAYFHASSPVKTEDVSQIWGKISYPYLVSVENVEDEDYANRTSVVELSYEDFKAKIVENVDDNYTIKENRGDNIVCINEYTSSGRVSTVSIGNNIVSAEKLRTIFGLKSTNFTIELKESTIVFNVIGYGHGVGMSQVGANYLAKQGKTAEEIIKYYYTGVLVIKGK